MVWWYFPEAMRMWLVVWRVVGGVIDRQGFVEVCDTSMIAVPVMNDIPYPKKLGTSPSAILPCVYFGI